MLQKPITRQWNEHINDTEWTTLVQTHTFPQLPVYVPPRTTEGMHRRAALATYRDQTISDDWGAVPVSPVFVGYGKPLKGGVPSTRLRTMADPMQVSHRLLCYEIDTNNTLIDRTSENMNPRYLVYETETLNASRKFCSRVFRNACIDGDRNNLDSSFERAVHLTFKSCRRLHSYAHCAFYNPSKHTVIDPDDPVVATALLQWKCGPTDVCFVPPAEYCQETLDATTVDYVEEDDDDTETA
jgi:hypothetical protein